jgi:hypothetical protein
VSLSVFVLHAHRSNLFEVAVQQSRLQVRLVFALFGGVGAVRFVVDSTGQRVAYVELKNRENMAKAGVAFSFLERKSSKLRLNFKTPQFTVE